MGSDVLERVGSVNGGMEGWGRGWDAKAISKHTIKLENNSQTSFLNIEHSSHKGRLGIFSKKKRAWSTKLNRSKAMLEQAIEGSQVKKIL